MDPIIQSLLDTDLYKFTMQQCAIRRFSDVWVRYVFRSRNVLEWNATLHAELENQLDYFCSLSFSKDDLKYLSSLRFIKKDYIDFLKLYRPLKEHVRASFHNNELSIVVEGPWYQTILWEIPILATVSEIYYNSLMEKNHSKDDFYNVGRKNLTEKIDNFLNKSTNMCKNDYQDMCNGFKFSDFGTRRRFSFDWHNEVVKILKSNPDTFVGTSNVFFAKEYDLTPVGTNAHEYYQVGQALDHVRLSESQKYMLQSWVNEYRGDLGIALSDTLGTTKFLKDFDLYFAKLYDGVRHDSGDPIEWGYRIINHYKSMRINPKNKTLLFSDSLNFEKAFKIYNEFCKDIDVTFGIGTYLTNDFKPVVSPLNIVLKLQFVNDKPVAKISDDNGKTMCEDKDFLFYLKKVADE